MSKELAESLDPPVPQEEIAAAEAVEAPQEPKAEPEGEGVVTEEKEPAKAGKPPEGFVPHQALHAEREQRKAIQAKLAQVEQANQARYAQMEQRLHQIQQAALQSQQPKPPEFEADPLNNLKFGVDRTQQEIAQLREWQEQQNAQAQENYQRQQYVSQLQHTVASAETEFAQENPDYMEAVAHYKSVRAKQLSALGYGPQDVMGLVQNEAYQVAEAALRNGRNPAEAAFEIAKAAGWVKKQPEVNQKMETLQKGVKAASSLGSGGSATGNLTLEALADMPDDEFAAVMKSGKWASFGG